MAESRDTEMSASNPASDQGATPAVQARYTPITVSEAQSKGSKVFFNPGNQRSAQLTIASLPNELLSTICEFLEGPQPSAAALHDEPHFELTKSKTATVKAASCVSRRWRDVTMPLLFKHAQFTVKQPKEKRETFSTQIQPFFDFVRKFSLEKIIISLTLLIHDDKISDWPDDPHSLYSFAFFWQTLFRIVDPVELLIVAPAQALGYLASCHVFLGDVWCFDCPCQYLRLQRPPHSLRQTPSVERDVSPSQYKSADLGHKVVKPGSKSVVTGSISMHEDFERSDLNNEQVDDKEQSSDQFRRDTSDVVSADTSELFQIRPWSNLLLNEGSFIRAYATYEFWLRQPPSILPDLVGADTPHHRAYISPTVREMSYIGMFPMSSHFVALSANMPRLDRLYVQLVPRNDILQNKAKMSQVEMEDLWMERNSCYALLMRELFITPPVQNYKYLQSFESGDAADKDAWLMAVEYVKRAGNGWKVAGDGIFMRDPSDRPVFVPAPAENEQAHGDDAEEPSTLSVNSTT